MVSLILRKRGVIIDTADTVNISNIKTAVVFPTMGIWVDRVFVFELSVVEMNDMVSERGEFSISMCFFQVRISCLNVSEPVWR
jgi:hypothetical protein